MDKKEKPTSKVCKHCKSEIAYDAKICPHCRKKTKGGFFKFVLIAVAVVMAIGIVSGGDSSSGDDYKVGSVSQATGNSSGSASNSSTTAQTVYHVGDILQDGNMKIVYMASGEHKEENQYMQPEEGYKYIFLQFAFENTSNSANAAISAFSFYCYADGYSAESYYGGEEMLSATLAAGRMTTGFIYFTVPIDAQEIEVEYETNVLTEEKITFVYDGEKNSGYVMQLNTKPTEGAYAVGDIVDAGGVKITYLSCKEYKSDNMFVQPKAGYRYAICEFEFENNTSSDLYASVYDFNCYADGVSCEGCYLPEDSLSATISPVARQRGR